MHGPMQPPPATHLEAAEHEGPQDLVELRDEALLLLRVVDLEVEPLVELLGGAEDLGEEEVEERPQLVQAVWGVGV
jgi:hypothetical protein